MSESEALSHVRVVTYDPRWPELYAAEREALLRLGGAALLELEHIGSTSVPGLRAKPIIDMMAAVHDLAEAHALAPRLVERGYQLLQTGMKNRLFLRRHAEHDGHLFHLHIVERSTWDERKERLMRDYLIGHPEAAAEYGALKDRLAAEYTEDSLAYTQAKTAFIQGLIDRARARLGLPPMDVWTDQVVGTRR